ncbi:UNVERIFIED_CONTAM: hypothetical protein HDU68_010116 [Siphonaria sp. JEL0065]|nr:hypothetical protein HDU68_010116 [Siphonaria sp. JEL0065]
MGPKKKKPAPSARGFATASIPKAAPVFVPVATHVEAFVEAEPVEAVVDLVLSNDEKSKAKSKVLKTAFAKAAADAEKGVQGFETQTQTQTQSEVRLDHKTETKVLALVRKHDAFFFGSLNSVTVSSPTLTLADLALSYATLERCGFAKDDVELAMKTLPNESARELLNWLCIHLDLDRLPPSYSDKLSSDHHIPVSIVSVKAALSSDASDASDAASSAAVDASVLVPVDPSVSVDSETTPNNFDIDTDLKSRILRSLRRDDDDDDDDEARLKTISAIRGFQTRKAEVEYARLLQQQQGNDFKWDREFSNALNTLETLRIDAIAKASSKEKEIQAPPTKVIPQETPVIDNTNEDDEEGFGDMFDQNESSSTPTTNTNSYAIQILSLDIPKSWTGKTPRTHLQEHCASKLVQQKGVLKIKFEALPDSTPAKSRCRIKIDGLSTGSFALEPPRNVYISGQKLAEEYMATMALFKLFGSSCPVYRSLPPSFRDLWTEMVDSEKAEADAIVEKEEERRLEFLESLLADLAAKAASKKKSGGSASQDVDEDSVDESRKRGLESSERLSQTIKTQFMVRKSNPQYRKMAEFREQLPVSLMKAEILALIEKHQVVIISGETGSGKSTQIPQFLLEHAIEQGRASQTNIVCTQPRRISATSIASRVSEEFGDPQNFGNGALVGYSVRLDSRTSATTRLTFQTIGVLLRRAESDPLLTGITHVIVDEVHERGLESDFLVLRLRRLLRIRQDLRIILMSATADAAKFSAYFETFLGSTAVCPVLTIPGRTFPVEAFYLEDAVETTGYTIEAGSEFAIRNDYRKRNIGTVKVTGKGGNVANLALEMEESDDEATYYCDSASEYSKTTMDTLKKMDLTRIDLDLVETLVRNLVESNASVGDVNNESILVFLPGLAEIRKLYDRLTSEAIRENRKAKMLVLPLHSVLSAAEQAAVFKPAPRGVRKVVLSTNIAETGVTIPDVVYVIDTCKAREISYDQKRNITRLSEVSVSQANCRQRRGRAGRVKPGVCYHLVSKAGFEMMPAHRPPEMLRLPLEELVLRVLASTKVEGEVVDVRELLGEAPDPPPAKHVERAVTVLKQIQALSIKGELTPLGRQLASLPVDARLGKMLLYGCLFKCLDPVLTITASLSLGKDPFASRFDDSGQVNPAKQYDNGDSDLIAIANAYSAWRLHIIKESRSGSGWNAARDYCARNGLNFTNMTMIEEARLQLLRTLLSSGIIQAEKSDAVLPKPLLTKLPANVSINDKNTDLSVAAISSGIYPSFLVFSTLPSTASQSKKAQPVLHLPNGSDQVYISSKSFFNAHTLNEGSWYAAYSMTNSGNSVGGGTTTRIVARDLNLIGPEVVLAVSGNLLVDHQIRVIKSETELVKMKCPPRTASLLSKFLPCVQKALEVQLCGLKVGEEERVVVDEALELWSSLVGRVQK